MKRTFLILSICVIGLVLGRMTVEQLHVVVAILSLSVLSVGVLGLGIRFLIYFAIVYYINISPFADVLYRFRFSMPGLSTFNIAGLINLVIIILGLLYLTSNWYLRKTSIFKHGVSKLVLAFLLFSFVLILFSLNISNAISRWVRIAYPMVIFILIFMECKTKAAVLDILRVVFFSTAIFLLESVYYLVSGQGFAYRADLGLLRFKGAMVGGNGFAVVSFFLLCLYVSLYFHEKHRAKRLLLAVLSLTFFLGIILSYTRAVWVASVVALPFMLSLKRHWRGLLPVSFIIALFLYSPIFERGMGKIQEIAKNPLQFINENQLSGRLPQWRYTWTHFISGDPLSLIVGKGTGSTWTWAGRSLLLTGKADIHSDYINILGDSGLTGLFIFVSIFILIILDGINRLSSVTDRLAQSLALSQIGACIGLLVILFTFPALGCAPTLIPFWTIVGLSLSSERWARTGSF